MRCLPLLLLLVACEPALEGLEIVPPGEPALPSWPDPQPPGELDPARSENDLEACVAIVNEHRATLSLPPLHRSAELEVFAAEGARVDSAAAAPHEHFRTTRFTGRYRRLGENEAKAWDLERFGSVREVLRVSIDAMWAEGPGGGHYENMIAAFHEVGCGIFVDDDGVVTAVQDFRAY